jgi:hypothetical protein
MAKGDDSAAAVADGSADRNRKISARLATVANASTASTA